MFNLWLNKIWILEGKSGVFHCAKHGRLSGKRPLRDYSCWLFAPLQGRAKKLSRPVFYRKYFPPPFPLLFLFFAQVRVWFSSCVLFMFVGYPVSLLILKFSGLCYLDSPLSSCWFPWIYNYINSSSFWILRELAFSERLIFLLCFRLCIHWYISFFLWSLGIVFRTRSAEK